MATLIRCNRNSMIRRSFVTTAMRPPKSLRKAVASSHRAPQSLDSYWHETVISYLMCFRDSASVATTPDPVTARFKWLCAKRSLDQVVKSTVSQKTPGRFSTTESMSSRWVDSDSTDTRVRSADWSTDSRCDLDSYRRRMIKHCSCDIRLVRTSNSNTEWNAPNVFHFKIIELIFCNDNSYAKKTLTTLAQHQPNFHINVPHCYIDSR